MIRPKKIIAFCLAAVFLVSLTVYAASKAYWYKVKQNGTIVNIQVTEREIIKINQAATLKNSKNQVVWRWKRHNAAKTYLTKGSSNRCYYFPYSLNMYRFPPGKYTLVTDSYLKKISVPFTYTGGPVLKYHSTKVMTNSDGDMVQSFWFRRSNLNGKMINVQVFNNKNQMVFSRRFKSGRGNQIVMVDWNGWPSRNASKRCPRGVYTLKYWAGNSAPKTMKFRLAL